MWFYPLLGLLVLLGLSGAIFMGGVFTLVLVPVVAIVIVSMLGYAMWARSQTEAAGEGPSAGRPGRKPLPHHRPQAPSRVTATPEQLVEGRGQQQAPEA